MSNILGVFGLSLRTREVDIEEVFSDFGSLEKVTIVYDHRVSCYKNKKGYTMKRSLIL